MKIFFQKLTILLVICFGYTAEKSDAVPFNGFEVTSTLSEKKLRFKNYGYELKQVEQNGNQYIKPTIQQGDGLVAKPGEPYLPTVSTMYAISPNKRIEVQVEIIEQETLQNIDIIPFESWERDLTGNALKGNAYEQNKLFPEKCNVTIAQVITKKLIKVKVWERGAGLTKACGTAACATAFAGFINQLNSNQVDIEFKTGKLSIKIDANNYIKMKGPVSNIEKILIKL